MGRPMKDTCLFGLLMDPGLVRDSLRDEEEMIVPGSERSLLWIAASAIVPAMFDNQAFLCSVTGELQMTFLVAELD